MNYNDLDSFLNDSINNLKNQNKYIYSHALIALAETIIEASALFPDIDILDIRVKAKRILLETYYGDVL